MDFKLWQPIDKPTAVRFEECRAAAVLVFMYKRDSILNSMAVKLAA
jgi:hypothetical protein